MRPAQAIYQGRSATFWVCELCTERSQTAENAIRQMGAASLPLYLAMLQTKEAAWKDRLVWWSYRLVPRISQQLQRYHWDYPERSRELARRCFEILGPAARPAIPQLLALMQREAGGHNAYLAEEAACALKFIGPEGLQSLVQCLTNRSSAVRCVAADILSSTGLEGRPAIPALLDSLENPNAAVRSSALQALLRLTERSRDAGMDCRALEAALVPVLLEQLTSGDAEDRQSAAFYLGTMHNPSTLPALLLALKDTDHHVRYRACQALGEIKGPSVVVVPALLQALDDPESEVRCHAADALAVYGPNAQTAFNRLRVLRNATNLVERNAVCRALGQISPADAAKEGAN